MTLMSLPLIPLVRRGVVLLALLASLVALPAGGVVLGQVDDFQDATTQGWGGGASPTNVATGGPDGVGDRFLQISSTASNLGTANSIQWTGDYVAEDIVKLNMMVNNLGANPVALRLTLFSNVSSYTSTNATVLPAASGWVSVDFFLDDVGLTLTSGFETREQTLSDVVTIRLRHDPDPLDPPGTPNPTTGTVGIDDIQALPEPEALPTLLGGLLLLRWLGSNRRRRRADRSPR